MNFETLDTLLAIVLIIVFVLATNLASVLFDTWQV